jgi:hypothetical protein
MDHAVTTDMAADQTVTLPVGRAGDDDEGNLCDLSVRKMTGREEALLTDPKLRRNAGKLITALLANCVSTADGQRMEQALARKLSSADRNFLLMELRRVTFGDEMEAHYRCPRCDGVTLVIEDLSAIEVNRLHEASGELDITVMLEDGYVDQDGKRHRELVFTLPTGEDEEVVAGRRDANPSRQRDALLARCLIRVDDMDERRVRAIGIRLLADLSMSDRQLIRRTLDEHALGPDLNRAIRCEHCDEEFRTGLDMSHFFPLG